ncbi:MAG: IS66 family transposase [Candidatus Omnitrophota bacterium]
MFNQWPRLTVYLNDPRLRMDNNLAENAVRPFVVGRKNRLFSNRRANRSDRLALYSILLIML